MKSDKITPLVILLAAILLPVAASGDTEGGDKTAVLSERYILDNGKVYRADRSLQEISIEGNILGISSTDDTLYYIKGSDAGWNAGRYEYPEKGRAEFAIGNGFRGLHKLVCSDNIYYFLADYAPGENLNNAESASGEAERVLVRFNPENSEKKIIRGVEDFILSGNGVILLAASGLDCNGTVIPVTLKGKRYIERTIDGRFIFLTNGSEVEVIDIISERNVYIYREGKAFPYNTEYNIILEFNDTAVTNNAGDGSDNMIYYHVNLNGVEAGRTETAPPEVSKSSMIKTDTGKYCIIKAERWELDKMKGRYVRVNNIYQPEEVRLFVPENRIIKVRFDFDGEKYLLNQSVYEN